MSLHRILEIREGQQTAKFDKYPYDEVWYQSFSIVFEGLKSECPLLREPGWLAMQMTLLFKEFSHLFVVRLF